MNDIWSSQIQGIDTLYLTRRLRFCDFFAAQYRALFRLDGEKPLRILEIGCGPGALSGALRRWYPRAEITAIDRDSVFVEFAKAHEPGIGFVEGDATALPFEDGAFDVTISNTVCEHIEPAKFYGEQRRVLKEGGVCLVLSSRKGINITAKCLAEDEFERTFWEKIGAMDDSFEKYGVARYAMAEDELAAAMAQYGFRDATTGYAIADLTPDDPKYPREMALSMIEANRRGRLESIGLSRLVSNGAIEEHEFDEMARRVNVKFDLRAAQYERGEKQWDTNVSVIMVVRGVK